MNSVNGHNVILSCYPIKWVYDEAIATPTPSLSVLLPFPPPPLSLGSTLESVLHVFLKKQTTLHQRLAHRRNIFLLDFIFFECFGGSGPAYSCSSRRARHLMCLYAMQCVCMQAEMMKLQCKRKTLYVSVPFRRRTTRYNHTVGLCDHLPGTMLRSKSTVHSTTGSGDILNSWSFSN